MPCVLIVEDDDDSREMLDVLLTSYGYQTLTARNGQEALERMRRERPCIVLLDMQMPVMSGWEFRDHQVHDPALANVPVVCITAVYNPEDVEKKLGLNCIPKTAEFGRVLDAVAGACGSAGA
jgi:CheY-like chemotaxis protein